MAATALAAFFLIPGLGHVVNYPELHTPEVAAAVGAGRGSPRRWMRSSCFPNAGKDLSPGIFRAEALRAVYVDWKGGGQVNYLKELGEQWWSRWQEASAGPRRRRVLPQARNRLLGAADRGAGGGVEAGVRERAVHGLRVVNSQGEAVLTPVRPTRASAADHLGSAPSGVRPIHIS